MRADALSCPIVFLVHQDKCTETVSVYWMKLIGRLLGVSYRQCVPVALLVTKGTATTKCALNHSMRYSAFPTF
ncbi:hypothetical protein EH32_00360 [Erythrobacter litoralis]|uniref:Uncharacterized protein n=1 Tax=Erythrobacter litoralis TaxID=39960 RepID=A0A074N2Q9_9SPHN|nr:hypothetical protein EH32_00360 [Erythrobacter litoralis]